MTRVREARPGSSAALDLGSKPAFYKLLLFTSAPVEAIEGRVGGGRGGDRVILLQSHAIIIKQILRKCRLSQLYHVIYGWNQHFRPNILKANIFGLSLWKFKTLRVIEEYAHLKKYSTLQQKLIKLLYMGYILCLKCCLHPWMHFLSFPRRHLIKKATRVWLHGPVCALIPPSANSHSAPGHDWYLPP